MADTIQINTNKPILVNNRATVGAGPLTTQSRDTDPEVQRNIADTQPRSNVDIYVPLHG